jgi:putative component of membrane protein insertase Oxa1/YidC/SpoIIIJ protein YidD
MAYMKGEIRTSDQDIVAKHHNKGFAKSSKVMDFQSPQPVIKQRFWDSACGGVLALLLEVPATAISVVVFLFTVVLVRLTPDEAVIQKIKNENSNDFSTFQFSPHHVHKNIIGFFVLLYRRSLLPGWLHREGYGCRFIPSCTEYAIGAVNKYGLWHGLLLTGDRFRRCVPSYRGDYVDFP